MLKDKPIINLISETNDILQDALSKGITKVIPFETTSYLEQNTFIFSGFKTYRELKEVSMLLRGEDGGFKSFEKFKEDVIKIDNLYNKNYLNAEYNFAVQSSQMASKWLEFEESGEDYYLQYRTAGDDKVRSEHQALAGITLPVNDKFWSMYLPPNDWNCRCTVVQVLKDKYPLSSSEKASAMGATATSKPKQKIFRFNPGKELKVFPPKHPYLPKGCDDCNVLQLSEGNRKEQCEWCRRLRNEALKKEDIKIKEYLGKNEIVFENSNFATGKMKLTKESINNYLSHARALETKVLITTFKENQNLFQFKERRELGEGKDLSNKKDRNNISRKQKRGVLHYNVYYYKYKGKNWIIGFENIRNEFEQPYFIGIEKEK